MFSHVSSTINGIATIRAMKSEKKLTTEFDHHQVTTHFELLLFDIISETGMGTYLRYHGHGIFQIFYL